MSSDSKGPKKVFTVEFSGFAGLVHALARIPLEVNRALPLIEKGELSRAGDMLTDSLVKVELAKAVILGNLAFAAMRAGDVDKVKGFLAIGIDSLEDLGLEDTELGKMFQLVLLQLPPDKDEVAAVANAVAPDNTGETVAAVPATTGDATGTDTTEPKA